MEKSSFPKNYLGKILLESSVTEVYGSDACSPTSSN